MPTKNHGRMAQDMKRELIAIIGEMKDPPCERWFADRDPPGCDP